MGKNKLTLAAIVISIVALVCIIVPLSNNFSKLNEKFDEKVYEKKYNNSQYVIPQSKQPISDEELLSYAGYRYAQGLNPVLINSDHPPLGKYFIGWFTMLTGNNHVVSLFFGLGCIMLLVSFVFYLTRSALLSSITFLMMSIDSVFLDQMIYSPVMDIIQVFFLLLYFWIYLLWIKKKKNVLLIPLGIALGALAAIKLYFPAFVLLFITGIHLLLLKKRLKEIVFFIGLLAGLAFVTYTASYFNYFTQGYSFKEYLGTQKWIFLFWKNNSIDVANYYGAVIPFLLFNQWKVWWGDKQFIQFEHWTVFWPLFFILGFTSVLYFVPKLKKNYFNGISTFLALWIIAFTVYLCLIPISPRYIMMLYFPIYILFALFLKQKYGRIFKE